MRAADVLFLSPAAALRALFSVTQSRVRHVYNELNRGLDAWKVCIAAYFKRAPHCCQFAPQKQTTPPAAHSLLEICLYRFRLRRLLLSAQKAQEVGLTAATAASSAYLSKWCVCVAPASFQMLRTAFAEALHRWHRLPCTW